jgi:putative endonuclease
MSDREASAGDAMPVVAADGWWLYLLACADGRTYAGITLDVAARFRRHLAGKAAKFTRSNKPVGILGVQRFASKSEALRAERALKRLTKDEKLDWARRRPWQMPTPNESRKV